MSTKSYQAPTYKRVGGGFGRRQSCGIYMFDRVEFENEGPRFLGNPLPIVIPKKESIDIDDPEDLRFANKIK